MKKTIIWIVQSNQVTSSIYEYMKIIRTRMETFVNIEFKIPDTSAEMAERIKDLEPVVFRTTSKGTKNSFQAYLAKQNELKGGGFPEDLAFSDVLLLDDFGGGSVQQITADLPASEHTCGMIIQIPSPLGSSLNEEMVFHAMVLWARQNRIPITGYELLPIDIRWSLAPSLLDGIITRYPDSYDHLNTIPEMQNIRLLPLYESALFSITATQFHVSGVRAAYHYRKLYGIPPRRPIFYIPHNVAMIHEYQVLLQILLPAAGKIHLMFGYGKDQVRGSHTQKEIIEIVYKTELHHFKSFSFHDMTHSWEVLMSDGVIACASCFQTMIALENSLPTLIFDPALPPLATGLKKRIDKRDPLLEEIERIICRKDDTTEMADILMQMAHREPERTLC